MHLTCQIPIHSPVISPCSPSMGKTVWPGMRNEQLLNDYLSLPCPLPLFFFHLLSPALPFSFSTLSLSFYVVCVGNGSSVCLPPGRCPKAVSSTLHGHSNTDLQGCLQVRHQQPFPLSFACWRFSHHWWPSSHTVRKLSPSC